MTTKENLGDFVTKHIKARYCKRHVLKKDESKCFCGLWGNIVCDEGNWDPVKNTEEVITDAYGEMNLKGFSVFAGTQIKYIRASETKLLCDHLYYIMTEIWKFPKPDLIISINGGTKKMIPLSHEQKSEFKRGLINVLKTASTWIITGGFDFGVVKLVGEAAKDHNVVSQDKSLSVVGIGSWGAVFNRQDLIVKEGEEVTYHSPKGIFNYKGQAPLEPNHDAFILFDSGTVEKFGTEIKFRAKFETFLSSEANCSAVQVIVEGGKKCIITANEALKHGIPVVVMKGSKRAADLICDTIESDEKMMEKVIKDGLVKNRKEWAIETDKEMEELEVHLSSLYMFKKKNLIHIFSMSDFNKNLDRAILQAAFSGKDMTNEKKMDLAMNFNCPDVAEKCILDPLTSGDNTNNKGLELIYSCMIKALERDLWKFVYLFILRGSQVESFLNEETMAQLYHYKANDNYLNPEIFPETELPTVGLVIKKLTNNLIKNMYHKPEERKYTEQDLFIWALLTQRWEMSKLFWEKGKDHIGSALIAAVICNKLSDIARKQGEFDMMTALQSYQEEYENLAIRVLTEAYSRDKIRTQFQLLRAVTQWGNVTCMEIAHECHLVNFLSQSACQTYLNTVWLGGMLNSSYTSLLLNLPFAYLTSTLMFPEEHSKEKEVHKVGNESKELFAFRKRQNPLQNVSLCLAVKTYYKAPIIKFTMHIISYILFLAIFSYTLLVELMPLSVDIGHSQKKMEYALYVYILSFIVEEIRQAFFGTQSEKVESRLFDWISSMWNVFDIILYTMFIIAVVLRHITSIDFVYSRTIFAITLSIFFLRFLQFYYANRIIGPKVISVSRMMKDIIFFLALYVIAIFAYGIFAHALLYSNSPLNDFLLKNIVYMPYWQSYGDLRIEYVQGTVPLNGVSPTPNAIVIVGFAIYMLFTNVMLMNMLVAMFGMTLQKVEENSNRIWSFNRYRLIEEFYYRPILPPPLNVFEIVIRVIKFLYLKSEKKSKNTLNKKRFVISLEPNEELRSIGFEQKCMENIFLGNPLLKYHDEEEQRISTS